MNSHNELSREHARLVIEAADGDKDSFERLKEMIGAERTELEIAEQQAVRRAISSVELPASNGLAGDIARLDQAGESNSQLRLLQKSRRKSARWLTGAISAVAATLAFFAFSHIQHQQRVDEATKGYHYAMQRISQISAKGELAFQNSLQKSVQKPVSAMKKSEFIHSIIFPNNRSNTQ